MLASGYATAHAADSAAAEVALTLRDAVTLREGERERKHDVTLRLTRVEGEWVEAWARIEGEPPVWHRAHVTRSAGDAATGLRASVQVHFLPRAERNVRTAMLEGGFPGGTATYQLDMEPIAADPIRDRPRLSGTYRGTIDPANPATLNADGWTPAPPPPPPPPAEDDELGVDPEGDDDAGDQLPPVPAAPPPPTPRDANTPPRLTTLAPSPVQGHAAAVVIPHAPAPSLEPRFVPGEHPRLFFRKADLDTLRRSAATPAAQRLLADLRVTLDRERLGFRGRDGQAPGYGQAMWAAGYGLLYQLTGDDAMADRSRRLVESALFTPHAYGEYHGPPMFILGTAIAYDLWYHAWPEDFRRVVRLYLERNIREITRLERGPDPLLQGDAYLFANPMPLGGRGAQTPHWNAYLRSVAALAALAILDDPHALPPPTPPDEAPPLAPAIEYDPWIGVPVVPYTNDHMPRVWLINGPFVVGPEAEHPLASIGGPERARPEPGDTLTSGDTPLPWRRFFPSGSDRPLVPGDSRTPNIYPRTDAVHWAFNHKYGGYLPAANVRGGGFDTRRMLYLYTVIDNRQARTVQALPNLGSTSLGVRMWLAGRELRDGDLARLRPGLYPLMLEMPQPGGYQHLSPRLRTYSQDDYQHDLRRYQLARPRHLAAGGSMPDIAQHLAALRPSLRDYLTRDIGPRGWGDAPGMGDYADAFRGVLPMTLAWRHTLGEDLAADSGLRELVPLAAQMAAARTPRYSGHERWLDAVRGGLHLFPQSDLPAARWMIERDGPGLNYATDAIPLLVNLPLLQGNAAPPGDLPDRFPLVAHHPQFGVHTFTGSFTDPQTSRIILTRGLYPDAARHAAGDFHARASGVQWITHASLDIAGLRPATGAALIDENSGDDASGAVVMRLENWRGEGVEGVEGVSWTRGTLIDSAGDDAEAGLLMVIADGLVGTAGREKTWQLVTGVRSDEIQVDRRTRTFTLHSGKDHHTMRGTIVLPQKGEGERGRIEVTNVEDSPRGIVRLRVETPRGPADTDPSRRLDVGIDELTRTGGAGATDDPLLEGLEAELAHAIARDRHAQENRRGEATQFLIVLTTAREGRHPEVKVESTRGDDVTLRIGSRRLRWDGKRFVGR